VGFVDKRSIANIEPTMMLRQPTPPPQPEPASEYKQLRSEIAELQAQVRELHAELEQHRAVAAQNLNAAVMNVCEETGALTAEVEKRLIEKIERGRAKPRVVA
jgi:hypothetical protein